MANRNLASQWNPWNRSKNEEGNPVMAIAGRSGMPASYFRPIASFYRDMDQVFETMLSNFGFGALMNAPFRPRVNIAATDGEYTVTVEAPGMSENDVDIEIANDNLVIRGEKKQESQDRDKDYVRVESSYGAFERSIPLPDDVDREDVDAVCENGLLTITLGRQEQSRAQRRRIEVNSGRSSSRTGESQKSKEYSSGSASSGGAGPGAKRAA